MTEVKKSKNYKDLIVWQKSVDLVSSVYVLTQKFPQEEKFGLTAQMRRAAVSIPSNIAEGSKRGTNKDFAQFLRMAYGSAAELETQLEIAKRLGFTKNTELKEVYASLDEILRMVYKVIESISKN